MHWNRDWIVGLRWEHVNRSGSLKASPRDLFLVLKLLDGTCYSTGSSGAIVQLRKDIQSLSVLNYNEGLVSFYDVEDDCIAHFILAHPVLLH